MSITVEKNINIRNHTTFKLDCIVSNFIIISNEEQILEAIDYANSKELNIIVLGGGSNTIFLEKDLDICLIKIEIVFYDWNIIKDNYLEVNVGAGVVWDDFVKESVEKGFSGIEMLSLIPGSVGGTPVQNVGAYGGEVSQNIVSVRVFDIKENIFKNLSNNECEFSYRDSLFKKQSNRYIIVSVCFKLDKKETEIPNYTGVKEYFIENNIVNPNLKDIRDAICNIRIKKLPDPKYIYSVGSFFKNVIVSKEIADRIKNSHPEIVVFDIDEFQSKIGTGSMIDNLGLKGKSFGNLSLYKNNALVVVNNGNATGEELIDLINYLKKLVKEKFDLDIEPEPVFYTLGGWAAK